MHFKAKYITKGVSFLLLAVMLQTYVCSALCSVGAYSCCSAMKNEHDCCKKSKHSNKEDNNKPKDDCQKEHNAFFATIGQFHSNENVSLDNPFQNLFAIISTLVVFHQTSVNTYILPYTGFRPPPPESDIRILISSFQI